jgi:hypothetical protein
LPECGCSRPFTKDQNTLKVIVVSDRSIPSMPSRLSLMYLPIS